MDQETKVLREVNDQPESDRRLVNHVKQKLEDIRSSSSRISQESIWMTNIAYVLGYDGVKYNNYTRNFEFARPFSGAVGNNRSHVNKILPTLQNRLAKNVKNPPRYDVLPESNDTEDKDAARANLQLLNFMWDKLNINEKRLSLHMWVQQCGHAYLKVSWDDTQGPLITDPLTGEVDTMGDVRVDVVSPFEMFPDPLCKNWDDVKDSWIIQAKVRTLDYFKNRYEKGHLVKEESPWLLSLQYEERVNSMNTRGTTSDYQSKTKNTAIEMIKYEARCKDYPNGRMIVCANGVLLEDKPLPVGMIPFAKFDDIIVGGKYESESIVTHLRPIQDMFNETIRRRSLWTRKMLAGKYVVARGSGLQQESLNDQSGEILNYTPVPSAPDGGRPTQLDVPNIPNYAYTETEMHEKYFNDVSGISEISRGSVPAAGIPAIGMQLLIESDDTRIAVMTDQHERAYALIGSLILKYIEKFYILPRKIKITGKNSEYSIKEITGKDIGGNTDVIVVKGSTVPGSKSLRRQEILNAFNLGLLGDPKDPKVREKVLGLIEFGDIQGVWEDYSIDMNQIRRGMDRLQAGESIEINELDNHALWIQELNKFRKSEKFELADDTIKNVVTQAINGHLRFLVDLTTPPPQPMPMQPPPEEGLLPGEPATASETLGQQLAESNVIQMTENNQNIGGI